MSDLLTRLLLNTNDFEANLGRSRKQISTFDKQMAHFGRVATGALSGLAGAAGLASVGAILADANQKTMVFEKSLSSLKALTGVSAEEMSFFKAEAIRLGSTTTQTASEVADAFKIMGSQMPELLKSKSALASITEQAIVLAEAAELDVPTAAKALTGSLNQMGEGASRASDYINILAAASQQGSADIPYLNAAIEKAGGTSSAVGVKFNELVAAIETIAPKITEASSAGLHLRNIFLTLESSADKSLKPSVVGLGEALKNLSAKNLDVTEMTKLFGKESVSAALALVGAKDNYLNYTESIKGTNTALEQQRINNTNLDGSLKSLGSAYEGLILSLNSSQGILMEAVNFTTTVLNNLAEHFKSDEGKQVDASREKTKAMLKFSNDRIAQYEKEGKSRKEAIQIVQGENDFVDNKALDKYKIKKAEAEERRAYNQKLQPGTNVKGNKKVYYDQDYIDNMIEVENEVIRICNAELEARKTVSKELANQILMIEKKAEIPTKEDTKTVGIDLGGSLAELDAQLSDWRTKYNEATTQEARNAATEMIRELSSKKIIMQAEVHVTQIVTTINEGVTGEGSKGKNPKDITSFEGALPIFEPKDISESIDQNIDYADSLNMITTAIGSVNGAISGGSDNWLSYASNVIQAIGAMLPALSTLIFKESVLGVTSQAKLPFPLNIVSMAATGVALGAAIGSLPKFESGGIVKGSSFTGDNVLARVNSGEMILNNSQQNRLFGLANGGYNHTPLPVPPYFSSTVVGKVQPYSEGSNTISKKLSMENQKRVEGVKVSGVLKVKARELIAVLHNEEKYRSRTR